MRVGKYKFTLNLCFYQNTYLIADALRRDSMPFFGKDCVLSDFAFRDFTGNLILIPDCFLGFFAGGGGGFKSMVNLTHPSSLSLSS